MTGNRIANGKAGEDDAELFRAWEDVIADMENASRREITISASPENELLKIAEMIECHIDIIGDKPKISQKKEKGIIICFIKYMNN